MYNLIRVIIKQYKFCEISCHDLSHVWYVGEVGFAVNSFNLDNSINNVGEGPDVGMFDRRGAPWNQFEVIDGGRLGHLSTWLTEYVVDLVRMSFWRFHYPRRSVKACLPACLLTCLLGRLLASSNERSRSKNRANVVSASVHAEYPSTSEPEWQARRLVHVTGMVRLPAEMHYSLDSCWRPDL